MPRFLSALCLLLATAQLHAQKVEFRTLCFEPRGGITEISVPGPKDGETLAIPLYQDYSPVFETIAKDGVIDFTVPDPDAKGGQPSQKSIGSAKIPGSGPLLFVFLPGPSEEKPYHILTLKDDTTSFPWGHMRLLNIAKVPVRFHLGEHEGPKAKLVKPGAMIDVEPIRKLNAYNMFNVVIEFGTADGKFFTVNNTRWKAVKIKRSLAIAFVDARTEAPVVALFDDIQPAVVE
ncbi:MAG: hypothetical protein RLZ97_1344 [Verrucomicrobiota bacterium]